MELTLTRTTPTDKSLIGILDIDGIFECYTLERSHQDPEIRPIPEGKYPVQIRYSPHFQRDVPHVDNVPGRSFIEIHWGNTYEDTDGCILVGTHKLPNAVFNSRIAFSILFDKLKNCQENVNITIKENTDEKVT